MAAPLRVCIVGAESTGKTTLVAELAAALRARGHPVAVVNEALREWCTLRGRLPAPGEQAGIAHLQADAEDRAAAGLAGLPAPARVPVLIADTAPLVVATYSDWLFHDASLLPFALAHHRGYAATLLTGLDTPWVADGLRDGPASREPFDQRLRAHLAAAGIGWQLVIGHWPARAAHALRGLAPLLDGAAAARRSPGTTWQCATCGDAECEHRLFRRLLADRAAASS